MATLTEEHLNADARRELLEEILPFWRRRAVDADRGGFIGEMSNDLRVRPAANKGLILNGRILWTFSAVHRFAGLAEDEALARRAYEYLTRCFLDAQHGGFYWELNPDGRVVDDKKKIYGQAFGIYALAEYHRAFGDPAALQLAKDVFLLIEKHSHDPEHGGYCETLARDWQPCADVRLSDKDMNEKKSMNNHLHVLEAYTNLFRVWPDPQLSRRLRELIELFLRHILNREKTHFHHFFDETWTPKSDNYTFGHDIEGSWLLYEAAEALGDPGLLEPVGKVAVRIAKSVLLEGLDVDGGLFYEGRDGAIVNSDKEWWPQAEAVVGFYSAWQLTGNEIFRYAASSCWQFIQQHLVDRRHGEWFWKVSADGQPDDTLPKVSMWKCPYHNGRCCLEIMRRTQTVLNQRKYQMTANQFSEKAQKLFADHRALIERPNTPQGESNGVFERYQNPVLTAGHTPIFWRYDLNQETNPFLMERLGINCAFNPGAIEFHGKIHLVARVEGLDRKSFFAIAESESGVDRFRFWDLPVELPETGDPDINVYDMRLVAHEDGWIYGLFCTERKDPAAPRGDLSSAVAQCGIVRTQDLKTWERLDDLKTPSPQQRNVVVHPEFVGGKYAFYTRPQDGFINTGSGGGIGWALAESIEHAVTGPEKIVHDRKYHTIFESKNGLGPAPIKTPEGWLQLAHGVRNTAAGLRYVLYAFMTALDDPSRLIFEPGGYLLAPQDEERVGDVSNVTFSNGWVARKNGQVLIYYASSDTRCHVATTTVDRLVDYCQNTPRDPLRSAACVQQRIQLIRRNLEVLKDKPWAKV